MKIPTATEVRQRIRKGEESKKAPLRQIVKHYIRNEIAQALNEADGTCINEPIPSEAYSDIPKFIRYCQVMLKPLGYKAERSNDGGGMYDTLCVSW